MAHSFKHLLLATILLSVTMLCCGAEPGKTDPHFPFRTDFANETLPWYALKPLEFPPHHSDHRVGGELVDVDFIHRSGHFKVNKTGELVAFKMPPFATITYLNAEADLRDVPLETYFLFFLYQDETGGFTQLATMQEQFSMDAGHGFSYRLDELKLTDGKLLVAKQNVSKKQLDLGKSELLVSASTRVWKGGKPGKLGDLAAGDELLFNRTGATDKAPSRVTELWAGADSIKLASDTQRKTHNDFLRARGVPAWIDHVDGKKLTVTMLGDRENLQTLLKEEKVVPSQYASEHRQIRIAVADSDLRTYNPAVDKEGTTVQEILKAPNDVYGCAGERWVIEPNLMLEGFRKGHIIRLFLAPSWKAEDMPLGENVYYDSVAFETRELSLNQYPFRTDYGNTDMPWYTLKPGEFPPFLSEHRVYGELLSVDPSQRAGTFRADGSTDVVAFTLPPLGCVMYLKAEANLSDIPLGTRCLFYLHQAENKAFTVASMVTDEFTYLASNNLSHRIEALKLEDGKLILARQLPFAKNYNGDPFKPPDLGRAAIAVDASTVLWKADKRIKLSDLAVGDDVLLNTSGRTSTSTGRCTELWDGAEAFTHATDEQRKKHSAFIAEHGALALIDSVDTTKITVVFISGARNEFAALFSGDPKKKIAYVAATDSALNALGVARKAPVLTRLPELNTYGTIGSSGVRWELDVGPSNGLSVGQIVRIFKDPWPVKNEPAEKKALQ